MTRDRYRGGQGRAKLVRDGEGYGRQYCVSKQDLYRRAAELFSKMSKMLNKIRDIEKKGCGKG